MQQPETRWSTVTYGRQSAWSWVCFRTCGKHPRASEERMTAARLPGSPRPSSTMRSPAIRAAQTSFSLASRCGVSMAIAAKSRILLILKNFCGAPSWTASDSLLESTAGVRGTHRLCGLSRARHYRRACGRAYFEEQRKRWRTRAACGRLLWPGCDQLLPSFKRTSCTRMSNGSHVRANWRQCSQAQHRGNHRVARDAAHDEHSAKTALA